MIYSYEYADGRSVYDYFEFINAFYYGEREILTYYYNIISYTYYKIIILLNLSFYRNISIIITYEYRVFGSGKQ